MSFILIKHFLTECQIKYYLSHIIYKHPEVTFNFKISDIIIPFYLSEIVLVNPSEEGDICFSIESDDCHIEYELKLFTESDLNSYSIINRSNTCVMIESSSFSNTLENIFFDNPPVIYFVDGSTLRGNEFIELRKKYAPYPIEKIITWDWNGIDLTKESQGISKYPDSIQYKVISELKKEDYDIIFDDDAAGEISDIVTIKELENKYQVELYHCKFSSDPTPGARIKDLYEVCGQAQKSIRWLDKQPSDLINHMMRRDPRIKNTIPYSRFEVGDRNFLFEILEKSRYKEVNFKITIVFASPHYLDSFSGNLS